MHDLEVTSDVIDGIGQSELGLVGDNNGRRRIDFTFHSPKSVDSRLMLVGTHSSKLQTVYFFYSDHHKELNRQNYEIRKQ